MTISRHKNSLIIFGTIIVLNFTFFTFAAAQDLHMVLQKRNVHPKMDSCLVELEKEYEKGTIAAQVFAQRKNIKIDNQDKITAYLISEPETNVDVMSLRALGAEIIKSADNVMKVKAPINMLTTIADNVKGVSFIKMPDKLIPVDVQSQGVDLTAASSYHSGGYTGSGVKVAIIDVGFADLSSAISDGELPNDVEKVDCTVGCVATDFALETEKHGTAVAEIVYDVAPGAQLYLIKVADTLDLLDAKNYSINNGIEIINHSLVVANTNFYKGECWFGNAVCSADDAYANGILWVNAAGNEATMHYEATFTDSDSNGWHNISGSNENIEIFAFAGDTINVYLTWDAWPTTNQDYDLYLLDNSLSVVAQSENPQTGTQWPTEEIIYSVPVTGTGPYYYYLAIFQLPGATSDHRLEVYSVFHDLTPAVASSSLLSPADAAGAMAVGAINQAFWATGPQEYYSSRGPTNDGKIKPDICGPDFVSSYIYNGWFAGTSAASSHVAGAAALILHKNPTYSVSHLWNALTSSAIDMGSCGKDNIYGYGRLNLGGGGGSNCVSFGGGGGGSGGGGCFIDTAAYGSPMEP